MNKDPFEDKVPLEIRLAWLGTSLPSCEQLLLILPSTCLFPRLGKYNINLGQCQLTCYHQGKAGLMWVTCPFRLDFEFDFQESMSFSILHHLFLFTFLHLHWHKNFSCREYVFIPTSGHLSKNQTESYTKSKEQSSMPGNVVKMLTLQVTSFWMSCCLICS